MSRWAWLVLGLALLVRVQHLWGPLRWEERDLVAGLRDVSLWPLFVPLKVGDHTPLSSLVAAPWYHLAPHSPWVLRLPSLVCGCFLPVLGAWAVTRAWNPSAGLICGLLLATNAFLITWSAYFMQEMLFLTLSAAGMAALYAGLSRRGFLVLAAVLWALAFWTHEFALVLPPLASMVFARHAPRRAIPWGVAAAGLWALAVAPYFAWNLAHRAEFSTWGGVTIAQQHLGATLWAHRRLNARFLQFFFAGGLRDLLAGRQGFEMNHGEPLMGLGMLLAAAWAWRHWRQAAAFLCLSVFWAIVALFCVVDLEFRIYRFSLCLLPGSALLAVALERMSRSRLGRAVAGVLVAYWVIVAAWARPFAAGAAHQGFRWWHRGELFSERPLVDHLAGLQRLSPASVVILPGPFWDHVPLQVEYETGVRCVGGSRETIYASTYWMRPYAPDEAVRPRVVLSCLEDPQPWIQFLEDSGYRVDLLRRPVLFHGILQDTTFACDLLTISAHSPHPLPVQAFLAKVYESKP